MGILNNPVILRIRVPFQDFQPMEILNLELLPYPAASFDFAQDASTSLRILTCEFWDRLLVESSRIRKRLPEKCAIIYFNERYKI